MLSLMNNQNGIHSKRDSKTFQDYRKWYRSQYKSIAMNYKSIDTIVEKQHLKLYNIIYSEIQMPYMFSNHKKQIILKTIFLFKKKTFIPLEKY